MSSERQSISKRYKRAQVSSMLVKHTSSIFYCVRQCLLERVSVDISIFVRCARECGEARSGVYQKRTIKNWGTKKQAGYVRRKEGKIQIYNDCQERYTPYRIKGRALLDES